MTSSAGLFPTSHGDALVGDDLRRHPVSGIWWLTLAVVAILVVLFAIPTLRLISTQPFVGLHFNLDGTIFLIDRDSPAAHAGLQMSDQILALDDVPLTALSGEFKGVEQGQSSTITVRRNGVVETLPIQTTPPPPKQIVVYATLLLIAVIFWCVAVIVLSRRPPLKAAPHFVLFCLAGTTSLLALSPAEWNYDWARSAMYIALTLTGIAFLNLNIHFPYYEPSHRRNLVGKAAYLLWLLWAILVGIYGPEQLNAYTTALGLPDLPGRIARLSFAIAIGVSILLLVDIYRTSAGQLRRRLRIIGIGSIVSMVPIALVLLAEAVGYRWIDPVFAACCVVPLPFSYHIALSESDIIQQETQVLQWVSILFMLLLSAALYLASFSILSALFTEAYSVLSGILAALIVVIFSSPIHRQIENNMRYVFFLAQYQNPNELIDESLRSLTSVLGTAPDDMLIGVVRTLTHSLPHRLRIAAAGLWVVEEAGRWAHIGGAIAPASDHAALAKVLNEARSRVENDQNDSPLRSQHTMTPDVTTHPVAWWQPVVLGGRVVGMWAVGPKERNESFSAVDRSTLINTARGAALAINLSHVLSHLRQRRTDLQDVAWRLETLRAEEQERLAHELHDGVIGDMSFLTMELHTMQELLARGQVEAAMDKLPMLIERSNQGVEAARDVCNTLKPNVIYDEGLAHALSIMCERSDTVNDVRVEFDGEPITALSTEVVTALYRATQEAVTNAVRHSGGDTVRVTLEKDSQLLHIVVADNGHGFDPDGVRQGIGLTTTLQRMEQIGGTRMITSAATGTSVTFTYPLFAATHQAA